MNIQEYVDIKNYSTFQIGGQFRYFTKVDNEKELEGVYNFAKQNDVPVFILGGGSNIVFSDGVIDVLALKIEIKGFEIMAQTEESVDIKVGGGEIWDEIVEKAVDMNLQGLEGLSAIPGTVGATPVQNVGAYGSEIKDTIIEVEVFDTKDNTIKKLSNSDCKFGYRDSIFKNEAKGRYIIISVNYRLFNFAMEEYSFRKVLGSPRALPDRFQKNIPPSLAYPGVMKYFSAQGGSASGGDKIENPTLKQIRQAIIEIRKEKLPNPSEIPNVGSFFKNPIVENRFAEKIKIDFPNSKFFPIDEKFTKIPAGWLIENAGLKGKSFGNISVYEKNALVLVNNGKASKEDLLKAKYEIIKTVEEKFGITLEQEPEII